MEALLWPRLVAPALNASAAPLSDVELVALLISGRLRDADQIAEALGVANGWDGLVADALVATHPVASALAGWIEGFGRSRAATTALVNLADNQADLAQVEQTARTILAAVALATEERWPDVTYMLERALRAVDGLAAAVVTVQLSCRLGEMGDWTRAVALLDRLLGSPEDDHGELGQELRRVARENRWNLAPLEERDDDLLLLQRAPSNDAGLTASRHLASGLAHLADDALAVETAPASGPGLRYRDDDQALQQHLGAWLHQECWGRWAGVRTARARLGSYAALQQWLPYPSGWSHVTADETDLDLIRRSGQHRLISQVASRWWNVAPLEALRSGVTSVAERPWPRPTEQASLALLAAAGDLLDESAADQVVDRLAHLLDTGRGERSFAPEFDGSRALEGLLAAAGTRGHQRIASALTGWSDRAHMLLPLSRLPASLAPTMLGDSTLDALHRLAEAGAQSADLDRQSLAVELLLVLQRRDDCREQAATALATAFRQRPALALALGLLLSPSPPPVPPNEVGEFLRTYVGADRGEGWHDPYVLLAVVAESDPDFDDDVQRRLADPSVDLEAKSVILAQVALGTREGAARIVSEPVAQLLRVQSGEEPGTEQRLFGRVDRSAWLRALARAGRLDGGEALEWITQRLGGIRQDRWQAAHAWGALSGALQPEQASTLLAVLLADHDTEVAAEAAAQLPRSLPNTRDRTTAEPAVRRLLDRPGGLGPVTAARVLTRLGLATDADRTTWRQHPSALVRRVATTPS